MIIISQDSKIDRAKLNGLLDKYGSTMYTFNTQSVNDDIRKLEKLATSVTSKIAQENIKRTLKYLNVIAKKAQQGPLQILWTLRGNEIMSLPIEMRQIKMFEIQATDYISLENEAVLSLDYTEVIDALAFEIAYRDFGVSIEDIENKLSEVSIVGLYGADILRDVVEEKAYEHTLGMMIDDTPYMLADKSGMLDYFGNCIETDKFYRGVIENTRSIAMSIIMQEVLSKASKAGIKMKIAGVFETSVYLILPDGKNEDTAKILSDSVVLRTFGRKFEIQPGAQMY